MEHLVALYMDPPRHLFFFDECPGIQILKRLTPDLQTEEMKIRLEEFEYIRNGTMDVFAFLSHIDGVVLAECRADHTEPGSSGRQPTILTSRQSGTRCRMEGLGTSTYNRLRQ